MPALPEWVDPRSLAMASARVEGEITAAALSRLTPVLDPSREAGTIRLQLDFAEDSQRRVAITGRVQAELPLQCQRCLGPADWSADLALQVIAVADDDAAADVPRDWEPVVVGARGVSPAALAEDELLLALPVAPHCHDKTCRERYERRQSEGARTTEHPFAVLNELKPGR